MAVTVLAVPGVPLPLPVDCVWGWPDMVMSEPASAASSASVAAVWVDAISGMVTSGLTDSLETSPSQTDVAVPG